MMNRRIIDRSPWIVNGFGMGGSISLFVCLGVTLLLSVIRKLQFAEHEILIFTVLFYGIIFFIAHLDVRANLRLNRALMSRHSVRDVPAPLTGMNSAKARVKTILWNSITVISVAWLTPALVIYWIAPRDPGMAISACCVLFSMVGATAYLIKTGKQNQTVYNRLLYYAGVCCGVLTVVHFRPVF